MLSRRRFLHLGGFGGLAVLGAGGAFGLGCVDDGVRTPHGKPKLDPLPDDPNKPWWLRQDYAPVPESEAHDLPIVGAIPPGLAGLYLRNGPNPQSGDSSHWFLGDGMVHGVMLEGGKA